MTTNTFLYQPVGYVRLDLPLDKILGAIQTVGSAVFGQGFTRTKYFIHPSSEQFVVGDTLWSGLTRLYEMQRRISGQAPFQPGERVGIEVTMQPSVLDNPQHQIKFLLRLSDGMLLVQHDLHGTYTATGLDSAVNQVLFPYLTPQPLTTQVMRAEAASIQLEEQDVGGGNVTKITQSAHDKWFARG